MDAIGYISKWEIKIKMKIIVNGRFMLQDTTGVQRFALELSSSLSEKQHVVFIVPNRFFSRGFLGHIWEQFILPVRFYFSGGDVLLSLCNTGPLAVTNQLLVVHDLFFEDFPHWSSPSFVKLYKFIVPKLSRRVKKLFTVSQYSKSRLIDLYGIKESAVIVLGNAVNADLMSCHDESIVEFKKKYALDKYVITVATLQPRKNLQRLLDAWEKIHNKNSAQLLVVGGSEKHFSSHLVSTNKDVIFVGRLSDKELKCAYHGAVASVFVSLAEGFGIPILESFCCDTPVITSNCTSMPDVAGDAALLVDPYDTKDIENALSRLMADEHLRARLIIKGRGQLKKFSWDKFAAIMVDNIKI